MFHGGPGFKYSTLLSDIASFKMRKIVSETVGVILTHKPRWMFITSRRPGWPNGIPGVSDTEKAGMTLSRAQPNTRKKAQNAEDPKFTLTVHRTFAETLPGQRGPPSIGTPGLLCSACPSETYWPLCSRWLTAQRATHIETCSQTEAF